MMRGLCDHPGCHDPATARPIIVVHTRKRPEGKPVGQGLFHQVYVGEDRHVICYNTVGVDYCYYHQSTFNLKRYMTEATWSAIENQCDDMGLERPSKDSAQVQWEEACGAFGLSKEEEAKLLARQAGEFEDTVRHLLSG